MVCLSASDRCASSWSTRAAPGDFPTSMQPGGVKAYVRKEGPVTTHAYEIRVVGSLGPAARDAFADADIEVEPTATVISARLDQPALHALLDQVRALGLELIDIKQFQELPGWSPDRPGQPKPGSPGADDDLPDSPD
jgi:hypothetical protein